MIVHLTWRNVNVLSLAKSYLRIYMRISINATPILYSVLATFLHVLIMSPCENKISFSG